MSLTKRHASRNVEFELKFFLFTLRRLMNSIIIFRKKKLKIDIFNDYFVKYKTRTKSSRVATFTSWIVTSQVQFHWDTVQCLRKEHQRASVAWKSINSSPRLERAEPFWCTFRTPPDGNKPLEDQSLPPHWGNERQKTRVNSMVLLTSW